MDPPKVEVVLQLEMSKSVTDIRSFLGLSSYYIKFIEWFSKFAVPLRKLNRKGQAFVRDAQFDVIFQDLKKRLRLVSVLLFPSPNESFVVYSDAPYWV